MKTVTFAALIVLTVVPLANASWLSKSLTNTERTVNKALKDTNAEVNRSKEKLQKTATVAPMPGLSPAPAASPTPAKALVEKDVAVAEIEKLGDELKNARAEKIETEGEKKVANGINVTLVAAILGSIITMTTTGMFGRHDRREKFLAAVEREWHLESQGFDFAAIPNYQRLCRSQTAGVAGKRAERT